MIFDKENLFSDAQAITATAASTNYIDLGATGTVPYGSSALVRDIGKGEPLPLRIQVTEAFNTLTSLTVAIEVDDNTSFSSVRTVDTQTIALAGLTLGAVFEGLKYVPVGVNERYVRLNYTVTGAAPTLGKITAGIVAAHQDGY
jgi:hypothetical protein